jgi:serine/threonine protein kinase
MTDRLRKIGSFEVVDVLGRGGMAVVYRARQPKIGRDVALKELPFGAHGNPDGAVRFLQEARIAAALSHPNIVVVYDYFEADGHAYIAMELVDHGPLTPLMSRLSRGQSLGALEAVLSALAHASAAGIVHRDLKPANLLVARDGRIKVADFGIAKAYDATAQLGLTATGMAVGTPAYMAPEQATGADVDARTDLYATGVLAYELLLHRPPFEATLPWPTLMYKHVHEAPPDPLQVDPALPLALSEWLLRMLSKRPEDRPADAASAWSDLEEAAVEQLGWRWRRAARLTNLVGQLDAQPLTPAPFPDTQPGTTSSANSYETYKQPLPPGEMTTGDVSFLSASVEHEPDVAHGRAATPSPTDVAGSWPPSATKPNDGDAEAGHPAEVGSAGVVPTPTPDDELDASEAPTVPPSPAPPIANERARKSAARNAAEVPQSARAESSSPPVASAKPVAPAGSVRALQHPGRGAFGPSDRGAATPGSGGRQPTRSRKTLRPLAFAAVLAVSLMVLLLVFLGGHDVPGIPLENPPSALAVSDDAVWAASGGSLVRIDPATNDAVRHSLPVAGLFTRGIAVGHGYIWVTSEDGPVFDAALERIDPDDLDRDSDVRPIGGVAGVATGDNAVWVANTVDDVVLRIDPATSSRKARISVGDASEHPQALAIGADAVWVANGFDETVSRIDPATNRTVGDPIKLRGTAESLAVGRDAVWVANGFDETVSRIDPATNRMVGEPIAVGGNANAVAVSGRTVWVAVTDGDTLAGTVRRIDAVTNRLVGAPIKVGDDPVAIAVGHDAVWVANEGHNEDGSISRIDPTTNRTVET